MVESTEKVDADRSHLIVELAAALARMPELHDHVCGQRVRVEITRDGCSDVCVLISKSELDALEGALAILAESTHYLEMCEELRQAARAASMMHGESLAE